MIYDQHNETFHYEMETLKNYLPDPEITCIPIQHIYEMWNQSNEILRELDQLEAMGTKIPSLILAILKLRAQIYVIPENLNLEYRKEQSIET